LYRPTNSNARLDWYNAKSGQTKVYEKYILRQLINGTLEDVSLKEDVGYKAIEAIIDRNISSQIKWEAFEDLNILEIDEI
jgi:transposase